LGIKHLLLCAHVVVKALNLKIAACCFAGCVKEMCKKCVPDGQHQYFSSLQQLFSATVVAIAIVVA